MVNVGTGNLVVSAVDVDIHEAGIDLAFQRVYNSQSLHDYNQDDGGNKAIFGNLWTNNFDANIVYDQTANTFTIYDIDGTPCTYTSDTKGNWDPCTGEHATFAPTDGTDCTYAWTKTNGTVYWFHADNSGGTGCNISDAKKGHLQEILGRNLNNNITFTYSYSGSGTGPEDVTEIDANHSDGHELTMKFGLVPGTTINELATITRTDGKSMLQYYYDMSGNLLEVDRPGNDAASTLPETYAYVTGTSELKEACGARCTIATRKNPNSPSDGSSLLFSYDGSLRMTSWQVYGILNIDPGDGFGILQPWQSKGRTWEKAYEADFVYGAAGNCSNASAGTTTMCDTDLHSTSWSTDAGSRVTQTQAFTGPATSLVTKQAWDTDNDLVSTTDARGYGTEYAYDSSGTGNLIAVARPRPATGQDRLTSLYAYDDHHNVTSYCDPVYSAQNGLDWNSGSYSGSGCPGGAGTTHFAWTAPSDGSEPFKRIYQAWTACFNASCTDHFNSISEPGYHLTFTYTSNGLPKIVTGDTISQPGGSRTPMQTFGYDAYGNLNSYSNGGGTWSLNYDTLNRITSRVDPDPGNPTSYFYYNPDGSISLTETPYQHSLSKGHAFTHDADGDVLTQTVHRNNETGTITKAYDGLDRLVEAEEPGDPSGPYTNPWITRYIYDLTLGNTVSFNGSAYFSAYGNLYSTQELLPGGGSSVSYTGNPVSNGTFEPLKGTQYDALDRALGGYAIVNGNNALSTTTYDGTGEAGLVSQQCQPPVGQTKLCKNFAYDNDSRVTSITYSDPSSTTRSFTYDAAGHKLTAANGDGAQTYWYDLEGRVVNSQEPNQGTSPATYTHEFYADGKLKQLDVASKHLTQNGLFLYTYTTPGQLGSEAISYAPSSINTTVNFQFTAAGRLQQRTESGSDSNPNPTTFGYNNFGQLNAATYPGQQSNPFTVYTYNPEDDLTSFGTAQNTQQFVYTIRGELLPPVAFFPTFGSAIMANGTQVPIGFGPPTHPYKSTWDDRMGVLGTIITDYNIPSKESSTTYTYDGAGRQTQVYSNNCDLGGCNTNITTTTKRAYDVDNHTLDTTQSWTNSGQGGPFASNVSVYDWGPTDHPIRIGSADAVSSTPPPDSAATHDTLHWDGDQLIFTTNSSGNVDDIKIGASGDITPLDSGYAGLTFWDRGPGGAVLYCHNKNGSGGGGQVLQLPYQTAFNSSPCGAGHNFPTSIMWFNGPNNTNGKPRTGGPGQGNLLGMYRPDGISDGVNTIQGIRAVDASSSTWTTPDAFAGVADEPATQKSYVWNGNNPLSYADPSGYAAMLFFDPELGNGSGDAHAIDDPGAGVLDDTSNAGAPGSNCAATDAAHDCFSEGQTIMPKPGTKTSGYASYTDAVKAARDTYDWILTQGEVGCAVYCHGTNCGFGNATVASRDAGGEANLRIDYSGTKGATEVGVWHRHPPGDPTSFMNHLGTAQDWFRYHRDGPPTFSVYTSQDNKLFVQAYQFSTTQEVQPSEVP